MNPPPPTLQGFPSKSVKPNQQQGSPGILGQLKPPSESYPSNQRTQTFRHIRPDQDTSDIAHASRSRAKSQPPVRPILNPTPVSSTPAVKTQLPSSSPATPSRLNTGHAPCQRPKPVNFHVSDPNPVNEPSPHPARPSPVTQRRSNSSAPPSRYLAQGMRKESSAQVLLQQAWEMEADRHAEEVATLRAEIFNLQQQVEVVEQSSAAKEQETCRLQEQIAELATQLQNEQNNHDLSLANARQVVDMIRQKSAETESSFQALLQVNDDRVKNELVRLEQKLDEACIAIEAGVSQEVEKENRAGRLPAYHDVVNKYTTAIHGCKRATETARAAADELVASENARKEIEKRCAGLEKARDNAEGLVNGLKKERDIAETALSQAKIEWTAEKGELREEIKQLGNELKTLTNDNVILVAEKAEVTGVMKTIEVERDTALKKYDTAKEEVNEANGKLNLACSYLEKAGLLDSEGEYDELAQQALDEQDERHRSEIKSYETRVDSLNDEVKRLTAELSNAKKTTSSSQEKSQNDSNALRQAQNSISQLEIRLANKEDELRESMVTGRTSAQQLQSLQEEIQNAKSREKQAKTDLEKEKGHTQIVALKEKIAKLERQVVAQSNPASTVALTAAETELASSRQDMEKARKEIAQYESQLAQADETALERKELIEKLAAARVELLQELNDNKKSLAKSQQTVEEQAGRLKNLLERPGQAPTAQIQQELVNLKEDYDKLRKLTGQKEADVAKRYNEGNLTAEEKKAVQLAVQIANESWSEKIKKKDEEVKKYKQDAARLKAEADAIYKNFHGNPSSSDSSLSDPSERRTPPKAQTAGPSKSSMASSRSGGDSKKKARFANTSNSTPQVKSKQSTSRSVGKNADVAPSASLPESIGQFSSETNLDTSLDQAPAPQPKSRPANGTVQRKRKLDYIVSDSENETHPETDANQPDQKRSTRSTSRTPSLAMASQLSLPLPLFTQNPDKLHRNKASGNKKQETVTEETGDGEY